MNWGWLWFFRASAISATSRRGLRFLSMTRDLDYLRFAICRFDLRARRIRVGIQSREDRAFRFSIHRVDERCFRCINAFKLQRCGIGFFPRMLFRRKMPQVELNSLRLVDE